MVGLKINLVEGVLMTDIFLDTASIKEIDKFLSWGIGTGVTTNQKIFLKEK